MKLVDSVARSFRVAKVFRENSDQVNSIDFAPNGETLITASNNDSIVLYDCAFEGKPKRTLYSKKYGVTCLKYTHAGDTVIYGSNKVDDAIRYQSLEDNKYIRYYAGHTRRVLCLCMSPVDDTFLSGSLDNSVRLWDLRSPNCQGFVNMPFPPVVAFDPEGLVFAAGLNSELIKMYDLRSFDKGPFITFKLLREKKSVWTELKFSPDGTIILIASNGNCLKLIDAFNGKPRQDLAGHTNTKNHCLEASFTPDGQYVLSGNAFDYQVINKCVWSETVTELLLSVIIISRITITGSESGNMFVYDVDSGGVVGQLDGRCQDPLRRVKFNPRYMMLASASSTVSFWLPTVEE